MNLEHKQKELSALLDLPNNWNGHGDQEIDRTIVAKAHQFLLMICDLELPQIYPLHDGGVFMSWRTDERLMVNFLPGKTSLDASNVAIEWEEHDKDQLLDFPINDDFAYVNPIRQLIKRLDELQ